MSAEENKKNNKGERKTRKGAVLKKEVVSEVVYAWKGRGKSGTFRWLNPTWWTFEKKI